MSFCLMYLSNAILLNDIELCINLLSLYFQSMVQLSCVAFYPVNQLSGILMSATLPSVNLQCFNNVSVILLVPRLSVILLIKMSLSNNYFVTVNDDDAFNIGSFGFVGNIDIRCLWSETSRTSSFLQALITRPWIHTYLIDVLWSKL